MNAESGTGERRVRLARFARDPREYPGFLMLLAVRAFVSEPAKK